MDNKEGSIGFEPALVPRRKFAEKLGLVAGISVFARGIKFIVNEAVAPTIIRERLTAQINELAASGSEAVEARLRKVVQGAEDYWGLKINPNPMFLDKASSAVLLGNLFSVLAGVIPPNFYRDLRDTRNERTPGDAWANPSLDWLSRANGVGGLYGGQGRIFIHPDLLYSSDRLLHAIVHESGHAVHDVLNGMAKLTALPHSQFVNYDFGKITQAEDSFKYLTLEMQLRVRQLIGANGGFVSWYALSNQRERFAENFVTLFTQPGRVLDHIAYKNDDLTLEYLAMMDFLEFVTKGAMDRQYYQDLAANRICPEYWEKRVFGPTVRISRGAEDIYVTDLDRRSGGLSALIRVRPISIDGVGIEKVPWSVVPSGVIDTTLNNKQIRISPESSTTIGWPKTALDDPTMFGLDIWVRGVPISLAVLSRSKPIEIMFQTLQERVVFEFGLRDSALIYREVVRESIGISSLEKFSGGALSIAETLVLLASLDGVGKVTMARLAQIAIRQPNLIANLLFGEKEDRKVPAMARSVSRRRFLKGAALVGLTAAATVAGVVGFSQDPGEPLWERPSLARAAKGLTTRLQEARKRIAMGSLPWSSDEKREATEEGNIEEITVGEVPSGTQFLFESLGIDGGGNLRLKYFGTEQVMKWTREGGFVIVPGKDAINTEIVPANGQIAWGFYLGVDGLQKRGCGIISGAVEVLKELKHESEKPFMTLVDLMPFVDNDGFPYGVLRVEDVVGQMKYFKVNIIRERSVQELPLP